jgi:hypothetical protein
MKTYRYVFIALLAIVVVAGGWWFFSSPGEFETPDVKILGNFQAVGRHGIVNVALKDLRSGLNRATLSITQGDQTLNLVDTSFPGKAIHDKPCRFPLIRWP